MKTPNLGITVKINKLFDNNRLGTRHENLIELGKILF